jgi:hypothetical protein
MTRITNVEILIDDTTGGVILTCRVATCVAVCRAAPVWVGHGPVYCPRRDHHPTRRCDGAPHSSRPRRQRTDQATQRRAALDLSFALPRNEAQAVQAAVNRIVQQLGYVAQGADSRSRKSSGVAHCNSAR